MAKRTWNHRVVRRYREGYTWLEIAEVHYRDGKPIAHSLELRAPMSGQELDEAPDEADDLASIRWSLDHMLKALDKPILDEKADFKDETRGKSPRFPRKTALRKPIAGLWPSRR